MLSRVAALTADRCCHDRPYLLRTKWVVQIFVGDRVIYSLPKSEHDRNWAAWDVLAVAFTDLDLNGNDDIMMLSEYMTGIGPQGAVPFPAISIYYSRKQGFELDAALSQSLTEQGVETIGEALEVLRN